MMNDEYHVVFTECETAFRTINGKDVDDDEWDKLLDKKKDPFILIGSKDAEKA